MSETRAALTGLILLVLLGSLIGLAAHPRGARLAWMLSNGVIEGPILFTPLPGHGVTVADLPSLALFMVAAVVLLAPWE